MKSKRGQLSVNLNPMLSVARDGTVLYSNEVSEPLLQEWYAGTGGKLPSSIVDLVQSVISQNSPEKIEVKVGNKLYLVVLSPLPEQNCVNISGFDISDQKEFEKDMASEVREKSERDKLVEELRKSEEKYRAIVENAGEGIAISRTDGLITFVNQRMADMLGYGVDEMLGRPGLDFTFPDWERRVHEATVEVRESGALEGEFKLRRKDGSPLWTHYTAVRMFDEQGEHVANMGLHTDITESKRAEEALKESEERFRAVQENSLDRFTILKPFYDGQGEIIDFTYVYQNAQASKTTGRRPEELVGLRMTEVWPTFPQTRFFAIYKQAVETG